MPDTVESVIARLGGPSAAAQLLGVGLEALRKWRQNGVIPARHWPAVIAATGLALSDLPGSPPAPIPALETPKMPPDAATPPEGATACLTLADGTVFWGRGFGAPASGTPAELCFNTGITGYQETLTDPSYAGQIIVFTFPHIGNVGANPDDMEAPGIAARGVVVKEDVTAPSNWRATQRLDHWLRGHGVAGIAGVDTRALTLRIRDGVPPHGLLAFPANGRFDIPALVAQARAWPGLEGMDLAKAVSCTQPYRWTDGGFRFAGAPGDVPAGARHRVVAVDYGAKRNILRCLVDAGCDVTVVPATATAEQILRHQPHGLFLSNGPGDPAATGAYAVPAIRGVMESGVPVFGICLGHQLLAHALGGRTYKLDRGHHGANQPVKELATGRVEITSQNHGFAVDPDSLPDGVRPTHVSLFDDSNEGLECAARRAFSVQYHPEASPGPADARHLFQRFVALMDQRG